MRRLKLGFLGLIIPISQTLLIGQSIQLEREQDALRAPERSLFFIGKAFDLHLKDPKFVNPVFLAYTKDSLPYMYSSTITTSVCDDGLCQTLELKLFWDLLGNYVKFDTVPGVPLTKYDHLPFTDDDYKKLHRILADQNSVLERKSLDELFDKENTRKSNKVDAVTGATAMAVRNAIVTGALYSSYELWHITNGTIKRLIRDHTTSVYTVDLKESFLRSRDYRQQLFALRLFQPEDFEEDFDLLLDLLRTAKPLVQMYILKKLPVASWYSSHYQDQLIRSFADLHSNGRSLLISRLASLDSVGSKGMYFLSAHIDKMTIDQLVDYLEMLKRAPNTIRKSIRDNLKSASDIMADKAFYIEEFMNTNDW